MASVVCMCIVVLLAAVGQATNIIKGLYCQDPDSGKLYSVNTTWPSQTFCGNYTCKLRKKNTTETEYTPIQKIDITKYDKKNEEKGTTNDMTISSSDNSVVLVKKTDEHPIFNKDLKDNDGYLSESDIKAITDMLHTVKKSDLEAIVDIYNLAQDIYKEIDNSNKEKFVTKIPRTLGKLEKVDDNKQSYWYDPVHYHNKIDNKIVDMTREETKVVSTTKPYLNTKPTFFKGPLTDRDFGKLPYYYPLSNFQRLSSYTHSKPNIYDLEKAPTETKPCTKAANNNNYVTIPGYNAPIKKSEAIPTIQPSTLLPYPFSYIYHYNISGNPSNYYYNYPWAHVDYSRHRNYLQPYYGAYIVQIPSNGDNRNMNSVEKVKLSESRNSEEEFLDTFKPIINKTPLPDWQTAPLSEKTLEEVRAHMERPKSLKHLPFKKNIKLERLGKVIKLDELTRKKRELKSDNIGNTSENMYGDDLEAYIERTICESSTEPGYFSIGNMSQPYPACCPQKLDGLHTTREVIKVN